jgi:hypothetical protein
MIMSTFFGSFIVLWTIVLISVIMIGGYFMFRKFLKSMPKADGKSDLDWQDYYIDQTRPLWTDDTLALLNDLVSPVPELFRDIARRTIAAKIGQLALERKSDKINQEIIIEGYIRATPARDHKWLIEHLKNKQIDFSPYQQLLKVK